MRARTLAGLALGALAGYAGGRALLEREDLASRLPAPLRGMRPRLLAVRSAAALLLTEVRAATAEAERELTADYLRRTGRGPAGGA